MSFQETGAQVVLDILKREFGDADSSSPRSLGLYRRELLGYRVIDPTGNEDTFNPDCFVVVEEHVPMMLECIEPGLAVIDFVAMPITSIDADYRVWDLKRSLKSHIGEDLSEAMEMSDRESKAQSLRNIEAIDHEMEADYRRYERGRRSLSMGGPSGGF